MTRPTATLAAEMAAWERNALLIGVDEVGRGPLAGPVVAAAVAFPCQQELLPQIRDSKRVSSRAQREKLAILVHRTAAVGLGAASVREISQLNIRRSTALAMQRAIASCRRQLALNCSTELLIDGLAMPDLLEPHQALVQGDAHCQSIAAASLVAKVARDRLMDRLAQRRPGYGWETNAGYGTASHIAALHSLGLTPHHRVEFCSTATRQTTLFAK